MINLVALREELTTSLEAGGLTVYDHLPDQLHPPVVLIEPGDPYLTDEDPDIPYGHTQVNWTAHVIAKAGTAATQSIDLDELIVKTLYAMPDGWDIGTTSIPYTLTNGQRSWLATRINVSVTVRL